MRLIGRLNTEANAKTFGDYLTTLDIRNSVEPEGDGGWAVWVFSEDQLEASRQALASFVANPNDAKYQRAVEKAGAIRERELKEKAEFAKRVVTSEALWSRFNLGPLTLTLMVACIGLVLVAGFPSDGEYLKDEPYYRYLYFSLVPQAAAFLPEIRRGEVWRLVTPMFIHYGLLHLLFNMLWLKDLGSMIEARKGSLTLFVMVLAMAAVPFYFQYLVSGPAFGGMSGVIYGLFGFIWMRGKFDLASGLRLHPTNVIIMVGWFFLCVFKLVPDVANMAHGVGLVMGMIWGAVPPLTKKLLKL